MNGDILALVGLIAPMALLAAGFVVARLLRRRAGP
jgi:hypothetical protein